jgi:hypothetical protein
MGKRTHTNHDAPQVTSISDVDAFILREQVKAAPAPGEDTYCIGRLGIFHDKAAYIFMETTDGALYRMSEPFRRQVECLIILGLNRVITFPRMAKIKGDELDIGVSPYEYKCIRAFIDDQS